MTEQEIKFKNSIIRKITEYSIPVTFKEVISKYSNKFAEIKYNDNTKEVIDTGIEWFLCSKSASYFINNYCYISVPNLGIIPFKLYYFQKNMLNELPSFRKYVTLKTRQCLTEENFVMTDRGYVSIKDVKIGDKIETVVNDKICFVDVLDSFPNGEKETCHILTNSGLTIDCTLDHKIFTKRGWVEAENLCLKDEIVSIINKGNFGNFELENDNLAAFIGYYLADGRASHPCFVNTNIDYINEMLEIGKTFHKCDPYIYKRKKRENRKQAYEVMFFSNTKNPYFTRPVKEFLKKFGLNIVGKNRKLTKDLMNLNKKQMSIMLNRLYAGDGWITYKKVNKRKNYIQYEIGLGSPCFDFIKQIEYILQTKYDIHCYIGEMKEKRTDNRFWKLRIAQKKSILKFIQEIGIKGKTDTKEITDLISNENPYKTNQSFEKIRKIIRKNKKEKVYDITTSSSDFLANGLLVHNCGVSTVTAFYCLWRALFRTSESIAVVSKNLKAAQDFVAKIKVTLDMLPSFLNLKLETENKSSLVFINKSEIKSEARSPNAGRSSTLSLLVLDEVAFYGSENMAYQIVASAQPTLTRTGGGIIVISTPNGTSGSGKYYYEQIQQLKINGNTKEEKLLEIDWYEVPDIKGIYPQKGYNSILEDFIEKDYFNNNELRKNLKTFFKPVEDNWKQNEWLKAQHNTLGDTLFRQEILHDFVIMGNSVFGSEIMERVRKRVKDPILIDKLGNSIIKGFWIWEHPKPKHRYIISCDISKGTGKDSSCIQVIDSENYEQAAEYLGFSSTPEFSRIVKKVANYYNQGFVIIESNGIGEAVFNGVYSDSQDPYNNVYKQKITRNGITVMTGWTTTQQTRQLITNNLIDWFSVDELWDEFKIYSSRIYAQMGTWIWSSTGRPDHAEGCVSGDTIITCKNGFKMIKDVNVGDEVLTHKGNFKKVLKTYKFKDENKKMLNVRFWGKQPLNITSNQKLYLERDGDVDFINFDDIYEANKYRATSIFSNLVIESKIDWFQDDLFLFFVGHVLADGSVTKKNTITITSSYNECDYIYNLYIEYFNKKNINNIKIYDYNTFKRITIVDKDLYNLLMGIGKKTEKDIISELRYLEPKKQLNILYGYIFGDGSFDGKRNGRISFNSISYRISYFIQSILFRNRICFNVFTSKSKRYEKTHKEQYSITILGDEIKKIILNNKFFEVLKYKNNFEKAYEVIMNKKKQSSTKINSYNNIFLFNNFRKIEKIDWDDFYYDLNVEEDHSYVANGIVVHNSHDDALMALAIGLYNRDKAINAGQSFLVAEDGNMIDYSVNDPLTVKNDKDNSWSFVTSEDEESSIEKLQKEMGCSFEQYNWIIGNE